MILLNKKEISWVFSMRDAIEAGKKAFRMYTEGKTNVPQRTNIPVEKHNGTMLFMPAYAEELDTASLKIINLYPGNAEKKLPTAPSQLLLMDAATGTVTALLDGDCVTRLRTGAASGAAFDLLARKGAKKGALIGTGSQAESQLEAMLTARSLEEVKVYSRNRERLTAFAERASRKLEAFGARILAASSADDAVDEADLIVTATPSPTPVFDAKRIKEGATLSCVGSYQFSMQELDPQALVRSSKIYFDSTEAVLSEAGDIVNSLNAGIISRAAFTGELGDVLLGHIPGRENEKEIIIFKTVGIGAQDLVTAREIYRKAAAEGIGTVWGK